MFTYFVFIFVAFVFWAISEVPKPHMDDRRRDIFNNSMKAVALIAVYVAVFELFWNNMNVWVLTLALALFVMKATTLSYRMFGKNYVVGAGLVDMSALVVAFVALVPTAIHIFKTMTVEQGSAVVIPYLTWSVVVKTIDAKRAEASKKSRHITIAMFLLIALVLYIASIVSLALR